MLSILLLAAMAAPPAPANSTPAAQVQPDPLLGNMIDVSRSLTSYGEDFGRMPACVRDAEKKPKYSLLVTVLRTFPQGSKERVLWQDIIKCGEPWYSPKILALAAKMPNELKGPTDEGCPDPLFSIWQGVYGDYAADTPFGRKANYDGRNYTVAVPVDYKRFLELHEKEDAELAKKIPAVARLVTEGKQWPWVRPGGVPLDALLAMRTTGDWKLIRKIANRRVVLTIYSEMEITPDRYGIFEFPDKGGPEEAFLPGPAGPLLANELRVLSSLTWYGLDFKRTPACVRDAEKKPKYSVLVTVLRTFLKGSKERTLGEEIIKCGEPWYSPRILALAAKLRNEFKGPIDEGCPDPLFSMWQGVYGDYAADTPLGRKAKYDGAEYGVVVPVHYKPFLKLHEKEDAELAKKIPAVARLVKEGKQWPWVRPGGVPLDALLSLQTDEDWKLIYKIGGKRMALSTYGDMEIKPDRVRLIFEFPDKGGPEQAFLPRPQPSTPVPVAP